jgi:formamidopyrimidine-DNA glycosylase
MPELPEITVIAKQMSKELVGKRVLHVEVKQPKILNMPVQKFLKALEGKTIKHVSTRGKWLFIELGRAHFMLINLGMGAELLYFKPKQKLPGKTQFELTFSDKTGFTIHFWWFGYVHLVSEKELSKHKLTANLGKSATDETLTLEHFKKLLSEKKTSVKNFLLDQKNVAGIGNVYVQDPLFIAGLHPNRKVSTLSDKEKELLFHAVRQTLSESIKLGGAFYERDLYGRRGRFTGDMFLVGYKLGKPCPTCGTTIEKVRTGSTASYICPSCQRLESRA